jgi:hypothetical protein
MFLDIHFLALHSSLHCGRSLKNGLNLASTYGRIKLKRRYQQYIFFCTKYCRKFAKKPVIGVLFLIASGTSFSANSQSNERLDA